MNSDTNPKKSEHDPHFVVLVHGIRTQGSWAEMVSAVLEKEATARVVTIKYGFFDVFRFLSPFVTRHGPVRRIVRELRDLRTLFPTAHISVIAHSFGTYGLVEALLEPDLSLHRVLFCGCIVPENFRRAPYRAQLGPDDLLNDCGTHDIWPVLAKALTWGYGATGTFGFGTVGVHDRFNKFAHGDYFDEAFVRDFWAPFIRDGEIRGTEWERKRTTPPYWLSLLAWLPLRWVPLLVISIMAVWFFWPNPNAEPAAKLTIGPQAMIGHYTGFPALITRLNFSNAGKPPATFTSFLMTAISPAGKRFPLEVEGNIIGGSFVPPLLMVEMKGGNSEHFDYSFFHYQADFYVLQQDLQALQIQLASTLAAPDPDRQIVPALLVQKARNQMDAAFIWTSGRWTLELAFTLNGHSRSVSQHFNLSPDEVANMKRIANLYPSGIGLLQAWKFIPARGAAPMITVTLLD